MAVVTGILVLCWLHISDICPEFPCYQKPFKSTNFAEQHCVGFFHFLIIMSTGNNFTLDGVF
jgi:hypothetical protein